MFFQTSPILFDNFLAHLAPIAVRSFVAMELVFEVKFPPTPWKRPAGTTQRFDSQVAEKSAFALLVWQQLKQSKALPEIQGTPFFAQHLPLAVSISFGFKKPLTSRLVAPTSKNDLDNLSKFVLDALQSNSLTGRIWGDDGQIVSLLATKQWADDEFITCKIWSI